MGDIFDIGAKAEQAHAQQDEACHQGHQQQAIKAMAVDDGGQQHDEGPGRAADLEAAAAKSRDDEAGDDGGVEAFLGAGMGGNGNGHGKRKGNNGNGQAGYGVAAKAIKSVTFAQGGHEFWGKLIPGRFYRLQGF